MRSDCRSNSAAAVGIFASLVLLAAPVQAQAQSWPQRPVRFIIPFGPGAGADIGARLIQERLQKRWGQPVVIENRPGGDSIIAIQAVLSANDDHTFLWGPSGNFIVHPFQYKKLPYDPSQHRAGRALLLDHPRRRRAGIDEDQDGRRVREAGARRTGQVQLRGGARASPSWRSTTSCTTPRSTTQKVPYKDIVQAANDRRRGAAADLFRVLRDPAAASAKAAASPCWRSSAKSGRRACKDIPTGIEAGFPELEMDGNVGLFASPRPCRRRWSSGSAPTSSRCPNDKAVEDRAQRDGADAGARRRQGVRQVDRRAARAYRQDRQDAGHQADTVIGEGSLSALILRSAERRVSKDAGGPWFETALRASSP